MENPWGKLGTSEGVYVLDSDKEIIDNFNKKANADFLIRVDNLPTPFIGNFKEAKILLLQLNPGSEIFPGLEPTENHEFEVYPRLKDVLLKNLHHEALEYPFFWLDPSLRLTGGFRYWARMFSQVIKKEDDYKRIANKVCCAQYFPYHSKNYKPIKQVIDSQNYTFELVKEFSQKPNRLIILMRGIKQWGSVLDLKALGVARLKSTRNPVLTENNFVDKFDFTNFLKYLE
jgi:uncharacterized protein YozE (UPF0346 family)